MSATRVKQDCRYVGAVPWMSHIYRLKDRQLLKTLMVGMVEDDQPR